MGATAIIIGAAVTEATQEGAIGMVSAGAAELGLANAPTTISRTRKSSRTARLALSGLDCAARL